MKCIHRDCNNKKAKCILIKQKYVFKEFRKLKYYMCEKCTFEFIRVYKKMFGIFIYRYTLINYESMINKL